jgi:hypothetical protein
MDCQVGALRPASLVRGNSKNLTLQAFQGRAKNEQLAGASEEKSTILRLELQKLMAPSAPLQHLRKWRRSKS